MFFKQIDVLIFIVISVLETAVSQHHVCLKAYDIGDKIQMNCTTDLLNNHVTFKHPNGEDYGRCEAPYLELCNLPNLSQDKAMHTTTLLINKSNDIYGTWTCYHGTRIGSDSVTIKQPETPTCDILSLHWKNTSVAFMVVFIISLLVNIVLAANYCVRRTKDNAIQSQDNTELQPLLDQNGDSTIGVCKACTMASVCAICSFCEIMFCEICCNIHKRSNPDHKVCQIDHVVTSKFDVNCKICKKQTAVHVCMHCVREMCFVCCEKHLKKYKGHKIKTLVLTHKKDQEGKKEETKHSHLPLIQHKYTIKTENVQNSPMPRICGVCFIDDGRIVITEYNYKKLKIFRKESFLFENDLGQEPKGMTNIEDNRIAITYPYEREIKLYEIKENAVNVINTFPLADKPFSIAYNQSHFAVELGEGDDGVIVILDNTGYILHTINNNEGFAYFTSNTIRLALNMNKRKVFVAALSKKSVSCVDFEGNVLWRQAVPSPRGIVFVENILSGKDIIIASKRWNLIFLMNSADGKNYIMMSGSVKGPRYIDFNIKEQLFCVQIDNGNILVYKFDISKVGEQIGE